MDQSLLDIALGFGLVPDDDMLGWCACPEVQAPIVATLTCF